MAASSKSRNNDSRSEEDSEKDVLDTIVSPANDSIAGSPEALTKMDDEEVVIVDVGLVASTLEGDDSEKDDVLVLMPSPPKKIEKRPYTGGLANLPEEVIVRLLPLVPAKETLALETTCKRFHKLIAENPAITQKWMKRVSVICGQLRVRLNWHLSRFHRRTVFHLAYDERHKEMDGRIAVMRDRKEVDRGEIIYEIRQLTPVLPTDVLLKHFMPKILAKVTVKDIEVYAPDDEPDLELLYQARSFIDEPACSLQLIANNADGCNVKDICFISDDYPGTTEDDSKTSISSTSSSSRESFLVNCTPNEDGKPIEKASFSMFRQLLPEKEKLLRRAFLKQLPAKDLLAFENTSTFYKQLVESNRKLCQKYDKSVYIKTANFKANINWHHMDYVRFEVCRTKDSDGITGFEYRDSDLGLDVVSIWDEIEETYHVNVCGPPPRIPESAVLEHLFNKILSRVHINTLILETYDLNHLDLFKRIMKNYQVPALQELELHSQGFCLQLIFKSTEDMPPADCVVQFCREFPNLSKIRFYDEIDTCLQPAYVAALIFHVDRNFTLVIQRNNYGNPGKEAAQAVGEQMLNNVVMEKWQRQGDRLVYTAHDGRQMECTIKVTGSCDTKIVVTPLHDDSEKEEALDTVVSPASDSIESLSDVTALTKRDDEEVVIADVDLVASTLEGDDSEKDDVLDTVVSTDDEDRRHSLHE